MIKGQNNMSGEKQESLTLSQKCFKQWEVEPSPWPAWDTRWGEEFSEGAQIF